MVDTEIIIPLYFNNLQLYQTIERSLGTLKEYYPDLSLILVDDASPIALPSHWPVTHRHEDNRGYTATVNTGLHASKADKLIIANDDIFFHAGCLDRFFDMKGLVICSPRDTASSPDDRFGSLWGMTRQTLYEVGYLAEEYKHFFSDLDYYNRAKEAGVTVVKWNDIIVDHPESSTYKTLDKDALFAFDQAEWLKRNRV